MIIHSSKDEKGFNDLLSTAQVNGEIPVPPKFVHDCVAEDRLLDATSYAYGSAVKKKRKRNSSPVLESSSDEESLDAAEKKRLAKNQKEAERRKRLMSEKDTAKSKATPKPSSSQPVALPARTPKPIPKARKKAAASTSGPRAPTPPGEHTREIWGPGYKFSPAEDEYALRYAKILIDHDHVISLSAIGKAVFEQVSNCIIFVTASESSRRCLTTVSHRGGSIWLRLRTIWTSGASVLGSHIGRLRVSRATLKQRPPNM